MTQPTTASDHPARNLSPRLTWGIFFAGALVVFVVPSLAVSAWAGSHPAPWVLITLALIELALGTGIVFSWLGLRHLPRSSLGMPTTSWPLDIGLAVGTVAIRLPLEMLVLIPAAGGDGNVGVQEILGFAQRGSLALGATIFLGVVGGGIAEELYFRGFMLGSLPLLFAHSRTALKWAAIGSIALYPLLHLPSTFPGLVSILLAGLTYVGVFLFTRRLTSAVFAHSLWNIVVTLAVVAVYG